MGVRGKRLAELAGLFRKAPFARFCEGNVAGCFIGSGRAQIFVLWKIRLVLAAGDRRRWRRAAATLAGSACLKGIGVLAAAWQVHGGPVGRHKGPAGPRFWTQEVDRHLAWRPVPAEVVAAIVQDELDALLAARVGGPEAIVTLVRTKHVAATAINRLHRSAGGHGGVTRVVRALRRACATDIQVVRVRSTVGARRGEVFTPEGRQIKRCAITACVRGGGQVGTVRWGKETGERGG